MNNASIGKKIKNLRLKKGYTQHELAKLMFVTARCIGNWEAERRKPDISALSLLSKIFSVDVDYFINPTVPVLSDIEIIIVDDEKHILNNCVQLVADVLPSTHVSGFENGDLAYTYAQKNIVSVAFIDIELSGEEGLSLARKLISLNPRINIIFLASSEEYAAKALGLYCSGYVVKPLSKKKIKEQIEHLRFPVANILLQG
jgi:transcriptional regulator with XRE-family HTH domain